VPDETARPFNEGEFVGETTLEKHADAEVAAHVYHRGEYDIFGDPARQEPSQSRNRSRCRT